MKDIGPIKMLQFENETIKNEINIVTTTNCNLNVELTNIHKRCL